MKKDPSRPRSGDASRRRERALAAPFFLLLAVLSAVSLLLPLRPRASLREKRALREMPAFSAESLWSGEYLSELGLWFSDTFPGRESLLELSERVNALHGLHRREVVLLSDSGPNDNAALDQLLAQAEAEARAIREAEELAEARAAAEAAAEAARPADPDAVIEEWEGLAGEDEASVYGELVVVDGTIVSLLGFDQAASDHHAEMVNRAADALAAEGVRFFNLPAPTSVSVLLSSEMTAALGSADQGKVLRYMFARENDRVGKVNAFNNLLKHNDEYIYFHTDHHWTARGAYYAYQAFCEAAGWEPVALSDFREWDMGEFVGSYTASVSSRNLRGDEMIALVPPHFDSIRMEIDGEPGYTSPIVDKSGAEKTMKYLCFIAGDNPLTVLTNDALPEAPDCLVIKDSYGNPFTVFLTEHYHRVYVLDYREKTPPVSALAAEYAVSDVILVQSIGVSQTPRTHSLLERLLW